MMKPCGSLDGLSLKEHCQKWDALARKIDSSKTTKELLIAIKNEYPDPNQMIAAHQYWVDKSRSTH